MQIQTITALTFPYDHVHDVYQEYYRSALRSFCQANGVAYLERSTAYSIPALRKARSVRQSYTLRNLLQRKWFAALVDGIAGVISRGPLLSPNSVGVYELLVTSGDRLTLCIDARDPGDIREDLAATCDLYFKSNFWPTLTYPSNVVPIANLNPLIGRDISYFRSLRPTPKTVDLFAFFRIWGGRDDLEGVEHNLSLIESLAKAPCSKFLCAYLIVGDIATLSKRLEDQGIQWTTEPMKKHELWQRAAASRLNIVRLGMHECIPWRMLDILSMGGCPVIDYGPRTRWPQPLIDRRHYLNLNTPPGTASMDAIPNRIESWLNEPDLIQSISRNTAAYFDQYLDTDKLGSSILATFEAKAGRVAHT